MASAIRAATLFLLITCSLSLASSDPSPTPWPEQFHSVLFVNVSGSLRINDLWYDYPNGRNINIIRYQLGKLLYDVEWTNGSSYYYTLDANEECRVEQFEVGILPPDWLGGADYLGQAYKDGFLCNVWTKVDFIWYYEDVVTKRPVYWIFYDGLSMHVMTFEVGVVLVGGENWQAPAYCFGNKGGEKSASRSNSERAVFSYFKDSSSISKTSKGTMSL